MSFFDDASLAFLPSGAAGKDGKAYSIKPTNGDGDFTFSRGSNLSATRIGSDGLIEKGRENIVLHSNKFDEGYWNKSNGCSIVGQTATDPFGVANNAWVVTFDGTFNGFISRALSDSSIKTMSIWVRTQSGTQDVQIGFGSAELVTKTITTTWQRIEKFTPTGNLYPRLSCNDAVTLEIFGFQVEIGLAATDYIESGASTGKAGLLEDEPRFDYSGGATCPSLLLEPSRTQLVQYSEAFSQWNSNLGSPVVTSNFATSPEGLTNATKITFPVSGDGVADVFGGVATGSDLVFSIYVKNIDASFTEIRIRNSITDFESRVNWTGSQITSVTTIDGTLEYEAVGNDWYRIWGAYTNDDTNQRPRLYSNGANSSYLVYGAQLEQGSYPTSYIPNHSGGTITRGDDLGSIGDYIGSTITFGPTDDFSIFYDGEVYQTDRMIIGGGDSGLNAGRLWIRENEIRLDGTTPSVSKMADTSVVVDLNTRFKLLVKRNGATIDFFLDGNKLTTTQGDTDATFVINSLFWSFNNVYTAFGKHKQLLVFPTALSDADCITLTT